VLLEVKPGLQLSWARGRVLERALRSTESRMLEVA
jgi:hypothetical protein